MFLDILLASLTISLLSLVGILVYQGKTLPHNVHRFILPSAVGVFLGVCFFELLPETFEASHEWGPLAVLAGFLGFYLLSHILRTYHHHHSAHDEDICLQSGARMLLIGDAVHNLADGVVIATAFMVNPAVGVITTIGIALHEIPQEIAEYSVLIQAGYSRLRALTLNFYSATSVMIGAVLTYFFGTTFSESIFILTGIAAGNLLYIATADLIPELRESHKEHFYASFGATLVGSVIIASLIMYTHSL
jgi:zinc and cadmium transporter